MTDFTQELSRLIFQYMPLLALFIALLAGYHFVVNDFKPRRTTAMGNSRSNGHSDIVPITRSHELTEAELGIYDIDNVGVLSPIEQRRLKMEKMIRDFSESSPQETAVVIKSWLSEK